MSEDPTTEPELEAMTTYQTTVCTGCGGSVARRRPSKTGRHYCPSQECQRLKARFYNQQRVTNGKSDEAELQRRQAEEREAEIVAFVSTLAQESRVDCADCGRPGVMPSYAHPAPDWQSACNALRSKPLPTDAITMSLMRAVYPS